MKRLLILCLLFVCVVGNAQITADSIIMTVAGKQIPLDEFLFIAQKNSEVDLSDRKSVENYVELFKNFKLKVAEAEAQGLNQTKTFKDDLERYRSQLTSTYLSDKEGEEAAVRMVYERNGEVLELSHILFRLPEKTLSKDTVAVYEEAMKAYQRIEKGEDFAALAKKYSSDKASAEKGGVLPVFGVGEMLNSFETAAFALNVPGEVSKPVKTRLGYHIIRLIEKKGLPSFESKKKSWGRKMAQGERNFEYYAAFDDRMKQEYGYVFYPEAYQELLALCNDYFPSDATFYEKAKDMNKVLFHVNGTDFPQKEFAYYIQRCPFSTKTYAGDFMQEVYDLFIREIVTTAERNNLVTKHPEFNLLLQEYRDGILLFEVSNKEVWNKPMEQQAQAEKEWVERLNQQYPVTINQKLVKKITKMKKK